MTTKTVSVQAFVFMEKGYAVNPDGTTDYCSQQVWAPAVWKCQVDDSSERIFVSKQTVTVEVPADFDPRPKIVAALKARERQATADYHLLVTDINRQINELQAIECSSEAVHLQSTD
jgi:spore coat polysaccharide biosynthesis protein SpsF (cytidylyltransferase family)